MSDPERPTGIAVTGEQGSGAEPAPDAAAEQRRAEDEANIKWLLAAVLHHELETDGDTA